MFPKQIQKRNGILLRLRTVKPTKNQPREKDNDGLNKSIKNQLYQGNPDVIKLLR